MIAGIGIDVVPVGRMALALRRTPRLADRVFTDAERDAAAHRPSPAASFAARFAAKEACRKALGVAIPWRDVEVVTGASGAPRIVVAGRDDLALHVSLTHAGGVAAAVVVAETRNG